MNNTTRGMALAFALALMLFGPASRAETAADFWGKTGIPELQGELEELGLVQLTNVKSGTVWSADAGLLGMPSLKFYLYWVPGSSTPILAIPISADLTVETLTKHFFDGEGYLQLGLRSPVVFWVPKGFTTLERSRMPAEVLAKAKSAGLPEVVRAAPGFNLFGRVGGGFAGQLSMIGLPNPNDLTVAVSRRKEKKDARSLKIVTAGIGLSADQPWSGPFGLASTTMRGATVRFTTVTDVQTKAKLKSREMWGTARIKDKDYTAYLQRDDAGLKETVAFDTREASLANYFDILQVLASTLGIPRIDLPSGLPLNMVVLSNPAYEPKVDAASPPVFTKMMFEGTKDLVQPANSELIANAAASFFGWSAASGHIKASKDGVDGKADFNDVKIGPIKTPSAKFILKVGATSSPEMRIEAQTGLYGTLNLVAEKNALSFAVTPQCPLRPVGFKAEITSLNVDDFPITPLIDDCFSKELEKLADGFKDGYDEVEDFFEEAGKDGATTAEGFYKTAVDDVDKYLVKRGESWGRELVNLKGVKDAPGYAKRGYEEARDRVVWLGNEISSLGEQIASLTRDIERLAESIWNSLTGKKKERSRKINTRDDYIAQKPAAEARRDQAKKIWEAKIEDAKNYPSPYVSASIGSAQDALLGAMTQAMVQPEVAKAMRALPAQVKDPVERAKLLGVRTTCPAMVMEEVCARVGFDRVCIPKMVRVERPCSLAELTADMRRQEAAKVYKTVSNLHTGGYGLRTVRVKLPFGGMANVQVAGRDEAYEGRGYLVDAKKAMISEAFEAKAQATAEALLPQAVGLLPSVTHDPEVKIVLHRPGQPDLCLSANVDGAGLAPCAPGPSEAQDWILQSNGTVMRIERESRWDRAWGGKSDYWLFLEAHGRKIEVMKSRARVQSGAAFFFDAIEGVIRYVPADAATPLCLQASDSGLTGGACPAPKDPAVGSRWRLANRAMGKSAPAGAKAMVAGGSRSLTVKSGSEGGLGLPALSPQAVTNLAPLRIEPPKPTRSAK